MFVLLYFVHGLVSSFITIMVLFCCRKDKSLAKKLSEFLEPWSLSELWEPLCRTDGSNPFCFTLLLIFVQGLLINCQLNKFQNNCRYLELSPPFA